MKDKGNYIVIGIAIGIGFMTEFVMVKSVISQWHHLQKKDAFFDIISKPYVPRKPYIPQNHYNATSNECCLICPIEVNASMNESTSDIEEEVCPLRPEPSIWAPYIKLQNSYVTNFPKHIIPNDIVEPISLYFKKSLVKFGLCYSELAPDLDLVVAWSLVLTGAFFILTVIKVLLALLWAAYGAWNILCLITWALFRFDLAIEEQQQQQQQQLQ